MTHAPDNDNNRETRSTQLPAVPIEQSISAHYLICLEDGRPMKMLKKYLFTHFALTPDQYRAKWGLPSEYPMVAPAYARQKTMEWAVAQIGMRSRPSQ